MKTGITTTRISMLRQWLGELPDDKTFTAKELWEAINSFCPLMTKEQEEQLLISLKFFYEKDKANIR